MEKLCKKIKEMVVIQNVEVIREAWNRPDIIHYAGSDKPWSNGDCVFIDYW